ncbi:MAG: hypothetical protein WCV79_02860 [Candidatus Paceibacterota bacterium]|jgi:hypothetical protein
MVSIIDQIWFSPLNVIYHGELLKRQLPNEKKKSKEFRKVVEAVTVAQMLIGVMIKEGKEHWMQLVGDNEGSPDIRTISYVESKDEKFDYMEQVDVEVVEYESHTSAAIPRFIVDTKLTGSKSYDENTVILCHVGSGVKSFLPDGITIKKVMDTVNSPCTVLLLAGTSPDASELELFTLKPNVGLMLRYNPIEELMRLGREKKFTGVINLKRGTKRPPTSNPSNKHYPFEKLGYVPTNSNQY